ncbi:MAG: hypothetical protein JXB47_01950 [Anaerolineae bacterium]|nr:hypothetical protein [Anaerolineae bacterium]
MYKFKTLVFAVLLVLAAGIGVAGAQDDTPEPEGSLSVMSGEWFAIAAKTIGIEEDALMEALEDGKTIAEIAEANGVDPQAVIDAIVEAQTKQFTEFARDFVNRGMDDFPFLGSEALPFDLEIVPGRPFGFFFGDIGRMPPMIEPFGRRGFEFFFLDPEIAPLNLNFADDKWLEVAAGAIGVEPDALREAVDGGKTIAEVAADHDVKVEDVVKAITDAMMDDISAQVEKGNLPARFAEEMRAHMARLVENFVEGRLSLDIRIGPMGGMHWW